MITVLVAEGIGSVTNQFQLFRVNTVILFEYCLHFILFLKIIKWKKGSRVIRGLLIVFILAWSITAIWIQPISSTLMSYPYVLGAVSLLTCVLIYFYELLVFKPAPNRLFKNFYSPIFAALFIWLATELPIFASFNYIIEHKLTVKELPWLKLKIYATRLYYLSYPIALLLWKKAD